jgi:glycosyltransferase involved in cell wall biosynthesis
MKKNLLSDQITVCIFAYNEEGRILRSIKNFNEIFEILIVDNFSHDKTKFIAEENGFKCISIKNPGFIETPEVMDLLWDRIKTNYILMAYVGEFIPFNLLKKYSEIANNQSYDVVRAFRLSVTAGEPIPISGNPRRGMDGDLRFYRRGSVSYSKNKVHEVGKIICNPNRVLNLVMEKKYHFIQFRDYDCSRTENVLRIYDDILAVQRFDGGQRFNFLSALLQSIKIFLSVYIRFGCYKFGMLGFLHSYYRFHMEFTIWLRIWELENGYTMDRVIDLNSANRNRREIELNKKTKL